jgi:glycosyltransferase involved in cell wall biosynthesis
MKILAHVHMFPPEHNAGSEVTMLALLSGMVQRGHEARVIAAESSQEYYEVDGIQVFCPPATTRNQDEWHLEHYRWADVALTHLNCTTHAMHCARDTNKPLVHLVHNNEQLRFHRVKQARTQLLIFNTEWLRAAYVEANEGVSHPVPINPSIVLHPIIYAERYAVERQGAEAVVFINLTVSKGALVFYELARRFPEVPFIGVRGAYGDQHEPPSLPNLKIHNQMPDLRPIYSKARVVLMPSDYESFGRVAVEAACSGIPAIVQPTLGLREALGVAGIYCDRKDIDAWEKELNRLFNDEPYYQERSKMALELANHLNPTEAMDKAENALQIVVTNGVDRSAWTVEALGEEAYIRKAVEGGYFDPRQSPGYRPPLTKPTISGRDLLTDRKIWLDSNGNPVDKSGTDQQILFAGENSSIPFDEALRVGIVDHGGVPFYDPAFRGRASDEQIAQAENKKVAKPPQFKLSQVSF